jgi:hypothetical protein
MQRGGPRGTLPPPSERHKPGPRWPLQVMVGVAVIAAAFFGMKLLRHEPGPPSSPRSAEPGEVTPPQEAQETAPVRPAATGTLDAGFIARLRLAGAYLLLGDIDVPPHIRNWIAEQRFAEATRALDAPARSNDRNAIVALARLAHACVLEGPDAQSALESAFGYAARRARDMPKEGQQRVEASIAFIRERQATMKQACAEARFDSQAITERLRRSAAAGDEMSLWELGNEAAPDAQRKHWTSAAMLGYPPAQLDLAESLMWENINGDRREQNRLNFWLTASARQSPRGKAMLAECMLKNCGVQSADGASAASLLQEAVLSGVTSALTLLASISGDDPAAPTDEQLYGLNAFLQRLNELGCFGEQYPTNAVNFQDHLQQLALRLSPSGLQEVPRLTEDYWREHGAQARSSLHCD